MSRSYKRTPVCKDGNASKKRGKKIANKKKEKRLIQDKNLIFIKKDMNLGTFVITDFMRTVKLNSTQKI